MSKESYIVKLVNGPTVKADSWVDVLRYIKYWDVKSVDVLQGSEVKYRIRVEEV